MMSIIFVLCILAMNQKQPHTQVEAMCMPRCLVLQHYVPKETLEGTQERVSSSATCSSNEIKKEHHEKKMKTVNEKNKQMTLCKQLTSWW
jgi:hypothetical protein